MADWDRNYGDIRTKGGTQNRGSNDQSAEDSSSLEGGRQRWEVACGYDGENEKVRRGEEDGDDDCVGDKQKKRRLAPGRRRQWQLVAEVAAVMKRRQWVSQGFDGEDSEWRHR